MAGINAGNTSALLSHSECFLCSTNDTLLHDKKKNTFKNSTHHLLIVLSFGGKYSALDTEDLRLIAWSSMQYLRSKAMYMYLKSRLI